MKHLTRIPLPTTPIPLPTPVRTTEDGVGWKPEKATTLRANRILIHARRYNQVTRGLSILNQLGGK